MKPLQKLGIKMRVAIGVLAIGIAVLMPAVGVYAASENDTYDTYLLDNCVLKKEGYAQARPIANMKKGEKIVFYPNKFGSDSEYNYMKRKKPVQHGYVDHNYVMY